MEHNDPRQSGQGKFCRNLLRAKRNIVLTGMPGCGKSTVGVLLAKATGLDFIDTDIYIQHRQGRPLQALLEELGRRRFIELEERHLCELTLDCHVVATGGSAVYGRLAMQHLGRRGLIVYLELPLEQIINRVHNLGSRGVVMEEGMSLAELYAERLPLYRQWADVTINCDQLTQEQIVTEIIQRTKRT